ncbi:uncharacterized protein [Panulirus ornatus]|uniref:uncharacterized protein n=1 Tax=Panulirus ornatus TaxID=150431 RepID=UPI003A84573C
MAPGRHHVSKRSMKRVEAEEIMEKHIRYKDFWTVDDTFDNFYTLQEVIDVLFNSVQGNRYEVEYLDNQNVTRLVIRCQICSKDLTYFDPFIAHENSGPHMKIRQRILNPKDPDLTGIIQRRPHNEPRGVFTEGSLEEEIDSSSHTILGVQFVYKEVVNGQETFTCQLCQQDSSVTRIRSSRMFTHLISKAHTRKYMDVKFGYVNKQLAEFDKTAQQYEEYEGKIHSPIVDFTKQLLPYMVGDTSGYSSSHGSSSHGRSRSCPKNQSHTHRSHSRSRRSHSPSCGYMSESSSCSIHSQSLSPSSCNSPPPEFLKPPLVDAEATVDMSEHPRPISKEINLLQEMECLEMLIEDKDMQELLVQSLWVLTNKLEKYYHRTNALFHGDGATYPLTSCTRKVKQKISELEIL